MPLGYVADVHQVEPGIDVGGHAALHKVDHDFAGRRGLEIVVSDRGGGVHDDHWQPIRGVAQGHLLGLEL